MKKIVLLLLGILIVSVGIAVAQNVCDSSNLDLCLDETNCTNASGYWYNDTCNVEECQVKEDCYPEGFEPSDCGDFYSCVNNQCSLGSNSCTAVCDSSNLDLCLDETNCTDAGGEWNNDTCNAPANETELPGCPELSREECGADDRCGWDEANNRCRNRNALKTGQGKALKQWVSDYLGSDECPEGCRCTGSVIKCDTEGGRVMTIVAGRSGNVIIQTKTLNASTMVELIKNGTGVYANTTRGMKKVKYLPDEAAEKARERLRLRNCSEENNCSMELKEIDRQLAYELQAERHAKLLGMFRKKMQVKAQIDAETGEIIRVKKPWWAFLATESEEE